MQPISTQLVDVIEVEKIALVVNKSTILLTIQASFLQIKHWNIELEGKLIMVEVLLGVVCYIQVTKNLNYCIKSTFDFMLNLFLCFKSKNIANVKPVKKFSLLTVRAVKKSHFA